MDIYIYTHIHTPHPLLLFQWSVSNHRSLHFECVWQVNYSQPCRNKDLFKHSRSSATLYEHYIVHGHWTIASILCWTSSSKNKLIINARWALVQSPSCSGKVFHKILEWVHGNLCPFSQECLCRQALVLDEKTRLTHNTKVITKVLNWVEVRVLCRSLTFLHTKHVNGSEHF